MADRASALERRLRESIRDVPDFPRPGILFKDITPLLGDAALFRDVVAALVRPLRAHGVDAVAGVEARGFLFAAPIALELGCTLVPMRKPDRLPRPTVHVDYQLEYGPDALEAHVDAIEPGQRVAVIDDLLATGGTSAAAVRALRQLGGDVVAAAFVVELAFLRGREHLDGVTVHTLIRYDAG